MPTPKGRKFTEAHKAAMRAAHLKQYENPEARTKLSIAQTKRFEDPAERMKMSQPGELNPNFGKVMSDEQKAKISAALRGKSQKPKSDTSNMRAPKSEEHKRKMSEAQKARRRREHNAN